MPVNGASKVESNCLTMCGRVDPFVSLGTGRRELTVPPDFWLELGSDPGAVSNFIVCLLVRLISLDSAHGLDPLFSVYRDLVELSVDQNKYKSWSGKSLPENLRPASLELQHSIVMTIYFLTEFYSYRPTSHLKHIYHRWNLARNNASGDGSGKLADFFEVKIVTPFSVAQSKDAVVHPPHVQLALGGERADSKLLARLVDQCRQNHRRAHFGLLPPDLSKLCLHTSVSEAVMYVGLQDLLSKSLSSGHPVFHLLLLSLGDLAVRGQSSSEQGDREDLLPLLQLLKDLVTMLFPVERGEAYKAVMPFYMWPVAHAACSRRLLTFLAQEGKIPGTSFRRKLLVENNLGLKLRNAEIRGQFVHMLVDVSTPGSHGDQFSDVFSNRDDLPTSESLHRTIIRSCFKSVFPSQRSYDLESHLKRLPQKTLVTICSECVEVMEGGVAREEAEFSDGIPDDLVASMNQIHQRILQESGLQNGETHENGGKLEKDDPTLSNDEALEIFPLPSPHIPTHTFQPCKYPQVQTKLREILVACQKQLSPVTNQRTLSQTSMDSTGSSHMDVEITRATSLRHPVESDEQDRHHLSNGKTLELPDNNGHFGGGGGGGKGDEEEEEEDHVASPDSGHVRSPDPVNPFSPPPPPVLNDANRHLVQNQQRPHSTEISSSSMLNNCHGDERGSPNSSDEVFNQCPNSQGSTSSNHSSPGTTKRGDVQPKLSRRQTVPAKFRNKYKSPAFSRSTRTSYIGPAPTYGSTRRREYKNMAGSPTLPRAILPQGTKILSTRRGSMSLPKKKTRVSLAVAGSPLHAAAPNLRVLKIVLAGGDQLVCHTAKAYAHLQTEEPNLLTGLDIRFYHVPVSKASTVDWSFPERSAGGGSGRDSIETVVGEQSKTCGQDVNIGRYMSHLDSWYERTVALAVHHTLRLIPPISNTLPSSSPSPPPPSPTPPPASSSSNSSSSSSSSIRPPLTPSKILVDSLAHYLREANHCIKAKLYKIKMVLRTEKQHRMENREVIMLHRMDIQRLSGKKSHRQAKPFEANIQLTELSLDGSYTRPDMMALKEVWSVRASNIPSATDPTAANPESECFELSVLTAHSEGGRFSKSRLTEQNNYHTHNLTLETKKDPLTVMVDGDPNTLIDNVIRLEVAPVYIGGSAPPTSSGVTGPDARTDQQLFFPLMTFWPIDL